MINKLGILTMKKQILSIIFTTTALSGCGGGGSDSSSQKPSANIQTGIFTDSPVKGLYYETATQSGLTNEQGEFNYVEGETVTFSLGSSVLGVSKAQSTITPFDLTGVKALKTQTDITNAFLSQTPNSYEKAINIATLLQGLDQDGNPQNGIDLADAHSKLANINVPLLVKSSGFTSNLNFLQARSIMQTSHTISFVTAAENMYESLGIEIESSLISKQTNNGNNAFFETIEFEYDQQNRVSAIKYDRNNDGVTDATQAFTYDQLGRLNTIYNSANNTTQTLGYDSQNNLTSRNTVDGNTLNLNEAFEYQDTRLTRFRLDTSADGQDDFVTSYIYDTDNNLTGYDIDSDGDSQTDKTVQINKKNGKVSRFIESTDNKTIDISYNYDALGNKISQNTQLSSTGTDFTNARFFYDNSNNLTRYELDKDLDGKADYIESYKYNQNKQRTEYRRDDNADGKWDFMAQYFYDASGKRIKMIEDSDGNGVVDKTWEANFQAAVRDSTWSEIAENLQ